MSQHENITPVTPLEEKILTGLPLTPEDREALKGHPELQALAADMQRMLPALEQGNPAEDQARQIDDMTWARWQKGVQAGIGMRRSRLNLGVLATLAAAMAVALGVGLMQQRQTPTPSSTRVAETAQMAQTLAQAMDLPDEAFGDLAEESVSEEVEAAFGDLEDDEALALMAVMGVVDEAAPATTEEESGSRG